MRQSVNYPDGVNYSYSAIAPFAALVLIDEILEGSDVNTSSILTASESKSKRGSILSHHK